MDADKGLEEPKKGEDAKAAEEDEDLQQQYSGLRGKGLLVDPGFFEDWKKCRDVDDLKKWAADYGTDFGMHPKLIFSRLCYAGQPLAYLLKALEDVTLGTPGNLNFLLDWLLRKDAGKRGKRRRLESDDMILLQQWMRRQLYLGLKAEEDILVFLRFVCRVSDATNDETLKCGFIASIFEGLRSSSVFQFKDLGKETQRRLSESITRGPVTRQSLDQGYSLIEAVQQSQLEGKDEKISAFIRGVFHVYASLRAPQKLEARFRDTISIALEMIEELPQKLACLVVLITTKALVEDHFRMPAVKAATMQLPDLWWSALAKTDILGSGEKTFLKPKIEHFLSNQKPEVAVPYLRQLDDRYKAQFILRWWLGPKSRTGRSRARYLFDGSCSAKEPDSPWVSMFHAARQCASDISKPSNVDVRLVFKVLQILRKSEAIVKIIKQARRFHPIIEESDIVYTIREHLGTRPHLAERLLSFYPQLRLEKCPELAERMILNPRSHAETALHYMRSRRTRFPVDREVFLRLRIQLLERMALAYSTAPHITPRMAFRNVHECYVQHAKERLGPPSLTIARALIRAGLVRPLQAGQWVNTTVVRWVLHIVRFTEGTDVADRIDETMYKWRGAIARNNATNCRAASQAIRRVRYDATKHSIGFRIRIQWSDYYRGYEKVYTPLEMPSP